MAAPNVLPSFVYKIHVAPEHQSDFAYPLSDIDDKDGFIHLSTAKQVPLTADRFFDSESRLLIQKLSLEQLQSSAADQSGTVKWEGNHGSVFPHWYVQPLAGALKGLGEVREYSRSKGQSWTDVLCHLH